MEAKKIHKIEADPSKFNHRQEKKELRITKTGKKFRSNESHLANNYKD